MEKECKPCKYFWNVLIAFDQFVNTIFGGDPDETISSRSGKLQDRVWWAKALCWFLNKIESEHCKKAVETDEGKNEVVE